jgi:hypothetical protein
MEAKRLSSLIVRSIGGASVGVKISTGDNDTLSQIISTVCAETVRRTTEKLAYNIFEQFQYQTNGDSYTADKIANQSISPPIPDDIQDAIATLLATQDNLKALLNGKPSARRQ